MPSLNHACARELPSSVLERGALIERINPWQIFADPLATGRVLRLNEEIGELQAVIAQVTGRAHAVRLAACLRRACIAGRTHAHTIRLKFSIPLFGACIGKFIIFRKSGTENSSEAHHMHARECKPGRCVNVCVYVCIYTRTVRTRRV
jgi:hypothetical protein